MYRIVGGVTLLCICCLVGAQLQPNLYRQHKKQWPTEKTWSLQKARQRNETPDFDKKLKSARPSEPTAFDVTPKRDNRGHRDRDFGRRKDCFRQFDHFVLIPADTNYALHGADITIDGFPIVYQDGGQVPAEGGVFIANNCSSHAYIRQVNLLTISYEGHFRKRKCDFEGIGIRN